MAVDSRDTELVLPPGTYAYVLDQTKGNINVYCGPIKQSLSNTDTLVVYNTATKRFETAIDRDHAICLNMVCPKGCYVTVENPAIGKRYPGVAKTETPPSDLLQMGRVENLAGPQSFALWPGQAAYVVKGHHLKSNQYLMVRIADDEAAQANWDAAVVRRVAEAVQQIDTKAAEQIHGDVLGIDTKTLVTGQLIIIKGTDVAFYIPPTGVEVLTDETGAYIRDAVTLERLEYSILLDESGNKEYKKGPDVVFPTPTQTFFMRKDESGKPRLDADGKPQRKFRAFELQPTNGIHIKVIADYEDEKKKKHKAGDEIFITGADTPIYYPREEHTTISYGGNEKTYAVAIPPGEGRYVLDRRKGNVKLVTGPAMFLPNPMDEVIVRRSLSPGECELYYPGNREVAQFNDSLRADGVDVSNDPATMNNVIARSITPSRRELMGATSFNGANTQSAQQSVMARSTVYTPPRMITLDTKFDGAVRINVWTGFAIQVVNSAGDRRTMIGPNTVLLEYDECLERLSLSKGKPKSGDTLINTPYLRYTSNSVSDIISLKTQDLTNVDVNVKYRVRFDADASDKWFSVDNYVQFLVDHLRSMIGNAIRNINVQEFYTNATNILRDVVLGTKDEETGTRSLKHFEENGMTVYDLELISVTVQDRAIAELLARSRQETLAESIALERAVSKTIHVTGMQENERQQLEQLAKTDALKDKLEDEGDAREASGQLAEIKASNSRAAEAEKGRLADTTAMKAVEALLLEIDHSKRQLDALYADADNKRLIEKEQELAAAHATRMAAVGPALVEAIVAMSETGQLQAMAEHLAPLALIRDTSLTGTLDQIFQGTALEGMVNNLKNLSRVGKPKQIEG